jgi:AraC-like DNA-binding protein
VVPDGCIDLIWTGNALLVAGPDTGPVIETVSPRATIVGVRFRPGAATAWLRSTAHQIANRRVALADLWGRRAHRLEEQLWRSATSDHAAGVLERSLLTEMPDAGPSDRRVHDLRAALTAHARTEAAGARDLAADLGLSERTVRRRCHELLGYGPKTFARILRFQRFIARAQRAERVSLAALASLCGYADQAHLSREVRRLSGLTPHAIVGQLAPAAHR